MILDDSLPVELAARTYEAQLARVRGLAKQAVMTKGARFAGLILFLFAPVFARWFLSGISAVEEQPYVSPFTYTMR